MSLRARYVLQMTAAMGLALVAFSLAAFVALALHLFLQAESQAASIAEAVAESLPTGGGTLNRQALDQEILGFAAEAGSRTFVFSPAGQLMASTPFEEGRPPSEPWTPGLVLRPFPVERAVVASRSGTVITEIPLKPALDLLKDVALTFLVLLLLTSLVVLAIARRGVSRVLLLVDRLTRRAREMQITGKVGPFIERQGAPDEFTRLSDVLSALTQDLEARRLRDRRLLAEAAHELRTPLQVLKGNLELLRPEADVDEATRRESMASVERAVGRMTKLAEDLLFLEHASDPPRTMKDMAVSTMLEEIREDAEAAFGGRRVEVLPPAHPLLFRSDPQKLTRAVWILLENADRYSPQGEVIALGAREGPDGTVAVDVLDRGPGIPEEEISKVFDRFYRGHTARQKEGTGLGLSIARALASSIGARLELENRKDGGLRATLLVPGPEAGDVRRKDVAAP